MDASVFDGVMTVRKPNRWLVGLASLPLVAAAALVIATVVTGTPFAVAAPHVSIVGAAALMTVIRRRPWAMMEDEIVHAGAHGLSVGDLEIARADIVRALYIPAGTAGVPMVRIERRARPAVEIVVRGDDEAHRLLRALGHDVATRRVSFRGWSPMLGGATRFLAIPVMLVAGALSAVVAANAPGTVPYPMFAAVVLLGLLYGVPSRVEVGADGVLVRWFGTTRFFSTREIEFTETFEEGFGRNRHVGVILHLAGGATHKLIVGGARWNNDDATALAARIDDVIAARRHGGPTAADALTRRGRPMGEWIRALRRVGAGMEANFRTASVDREQLWRVYESLASTADERAAAAVALSTDATPATVARIRVTADAVAEPTLRSAIHAAADGNDEALTEALRALDAERKG